jgi:hypothetical protein
MTRGHPHIRAVFPLSPFFGKGKNWSGTRECGIDPIFMLVSIYDAFAFAVAFYVTCFIMNNIFHLNS